jgi:hypothetical protein
VSVAEDFDELPSELATAFGTGGYAEMAIDKDREAEANEWCQSLAGDGSAK